MNIDLIQRRLTNMENKGIYIDGVDVSECERYRDGICFTGNGTCHKCDTNCQFAIWEVKEQLARKTEDYAELEQRHNDAYKQFQALKAQYDAVVAQNKQLQNERSEIKKYLGIGSKTIMERLEELQNFRDKDKEELFNYKQALEEIKEHIDKQCLKCRNSTFDDEYCAEERCAVWEILQKCKVALKTDD